MDYIGHHQAPAAADQGASQVPGFGRRCLRVSAIVAIVGLVSVVGGVLTGVFTHSAAIAIAAVVGIVAAGGFVVAVFECVMRPARH
ncbi:hypothetical protein N7523_005899 [Penicillium sp. IBT 18751x]|nr:hypothetical protein N7523_005899 [Penicillium sp. IBT 18751x]